MYEQFLANNVMCQSSPPTCSTCRDPSARFPNSDPVSIVCPGWLLDRDAEAGESETCALGAIIGEDLGHATTVVGGEGSSPPILYPGVLSSDKSYTDSHGDSEPEPAGTAAVTDAPVHGLRVRGEMAGSGGRLESGEGTSNDITAGRRISTLTSNQRMSVPALTPRGASPGLICGWCAYSPWLGTKANSPRSSGVVQSTSENPVNPLDAGLRESNSRHQSWGYIQAHEQFGPQLDVGN